MAPLSRPNLCGLRRGEQIGRMLADKVKIGRDDTGLKSQQVADLGVRRAMLDK